MTQSTTTRNGIQALRAIAFLLVLIQHAVFFASYAKKVDFTPYLMIDFGKMGVSLFFVISGYVMGECLGQGPRFMWNRVARIFPPFWLAVGLSWLLLSGYTYTPWTFDWTSFLLLPPATIAELNNSYAIPYWTLCYEIAFYIAVYGMILLRLKREAVATACIVWLAAIAVIDIYFTAPGITTHAPGWWILLSPVSIYFVVGLFVSTAGSGALERASGRQLMMIGALLWVVGQSYKLPLQTPSTAITAAAFAMVLLGAMRLPFPSALVRLGDMSYGAYLTHYMLIVAVVFGMPQTLTELPLAAVCALLLAVGGIGGLAYGWVEFQLHSRVFQKMFRGKGPRVGLTAPA